MADMTAEDERAPEAFVIMPMGNSEMDR